MYPEYIERNSVRYPIPDYLIPSMPELHGGLMQAKPSPMKIDMDADQFERLLYIWEFANNFSEFLETPTFKIEELAACLSYSTQGDPRFELNSEEVQDLDWTEHMQIRHIKEKGFHMINHLLSSLTSCYLRHLFPTDQSVGGTQAQAAAMVAENEKQNQILASIDKLVEDKLRLWPEIIRLVIDYAKSDDPDVFGPFSEEMETIKQKLVGIKPADFNATFSIDEKVTLLTVLIDCVHETTIFRLFLNKRVEDKAVYNKEKLEIYQQIKDLETRQQEFIKNYAEDESKMTQEQIEEQIEKLRQDLVEAGRSETRQIKDKILALERQMHYYQNQLDKFADQIKKKQRAIAQLQEKAHQSQIKTTMLGKDADRNEYWQFKDDSSRIYVRKAQQAPVKTENEVMEDQQDHKDPLQVQQLDSCNDEERLKQLKSQLSAAKPRLAANEYFTWHYYEREDQVDELIESLNFKGQFERKLQESLRKVRDRLKLKKAKKAASNSTLTAKADAAEKQEQKAEGNVSIGVPKVEEGAASITDVKEGASVQEKTQQEVQTSHDGETKTLKDAELTASEHAIKLEFEVKEEPVSDESEIDTVRHVMFETDNWEDCITEAVWFGQKIPMKRRGGGRFAAQLKDPVKEFFQDVVCFEACKDHLISISESFMEASKDLDREWDEQKVRHEWAQNVRAVSCISEFIPLIVQLDTGMSLPTSVTVKGGQNGEPTRIQRQKIQLFKFWPSQELRFAWQQYIEQAGSIKDNNGNALYIALMILDAACNQFIIRQAKRIELKNKQAMMQAVQQQPKTARSGTSSRPNVAAEQSGRQKRAANRSAYKYYESSDESESDEEEEDDEGAKENEVMEEQGSGASEDEESSEEESVQRRPTRGGAKKARTKQSAEPTPKKQNMVKSQRGRNRRVVQEESEEVDESDEESEQSVQKDDQSMGDEEEKNWDEYCYECEDGGNVMMCEECPKVAHYQCLGLSAPPKDDWWCNDCVPKKSQKQSLQSKGYLDTSEVNNRRRTRMTGGRNTSTTRQASITSMLQKRSTRRNK